MIPTELIQGEFNKWRNVLVGTVLGPEPSFRRLELLLKRKWSHLGLQTVTKIGKKIFLLRFASEDDKDRALTEGPLSYDNQPMVFQNWRPGMKLDCTEISGSESNVLSQKALSIIHPTQSLALLASSHHLPDLNVTGNSWRTSSSVKTTVAAVDSSNPAEKEQAENRKYHFVVANAKIMLDEEEHFKELLFERLLRYGERGKEQDFWFVIEPKFLDKFPNITKRLKRPAVALVSTDGPWITFMKLRLDRVLQESYDAGSPEEALVSNPVYLEFEKPEKWVAPYPKYNYRWWEPFLPPAIKVPNS